MGVCRGGGEGGVLLGGVTPCASFYGWGPTSFYFVTPMNDDCLSCVDTYTCISGDLIIQNELIIIAKLDLNSNKYTCIDLTCEILLTCQSTQFKEMALVYKITKIVIHVHIRFMYYLPDICFSVENY